MPRGLGQFAGRLELAVGGDDPGPGVSRSASAWRASTASCLLQRDVLDLDAFDVDAHGPSVRASITPQFALICPGSDSRCPGRARR